MPDDLKKKHPLDRKRINVNQQYEEEHWCDVFGCDEEELRNAVLKVGTSAGAVEAYLVMNNQKRS